MNRAGAIGDLPWRSWLLLCAGFAGAAGVMLAALAAHLRQSSVIETSSYFLISHAVAVIGLAALSGQTRRPQAWLGVATLMLAGAVLFSTDLALFALRRVHLFPLAAPTGGMMLIASWLGISLVASIELAFPHQASQPFGSEPRSTDV